MTDEAKALVDAKLYGMGVLKNGKHVPLEDVYLDPRDALIETQAREIERLNTLLSEMNDTDVIARTMAENERLRAALHGIAEFGGRHTGHGYSCHLLARAALAGDSHDQ